MLDLQVEEVTNHFQREIIALREQYDVDAGRLKETEAEVQM